MNGLRYKDICDKHDLSINTLKSWIKRYGWSDERKNLNKKGAPKNKRGAPLNNKEVKAVRQKVNDKKIIEEVVANVDLTDKQQLFCVYYLKYFNATKAYQKAYKCDYLTANTNGSRLLVNASVKGQIEKLKAERMAGVYVEGKDILQRYIDIAFSDITDFVEFGNEEIEIRDTNGNKKLDNEGNPIIKVINYVNFKDDTEVDGSLISSVSKGRDGVKVALLDKMKALDFLADNVGLLGKRDLVRIEAEKARTQKLQLEIDNMQTGNEDKPIEIVIRRKGEEDD